MRTLLGAIALVTSLAACGTDGQSDGGLAPDPGSTAGSSRVPAADGTVHTRGLVTVMDTGHPELCLGPVAESFPPQCGGPSIEGWDWSDHRGAFDQQGKTRWGQFAVSGTWDGATFTVTDATPAATYDPAPPDKPRVSEPERSYSKAELTRMATDVAHDVPGALGAFPRNGHVFVDTTYDDGSMQAQLDEQYGDGVVVVVPSLVDEQG